MNSNPQKVADKPECKTCRWFEKGLNEWEGECRRNPPQISLTAGVRWPEVNVNDWCGEHKSGR